MFLFWPLEHVRSIRVLELIRKCTWLLSCFYCRFFCTQSYLCLSFFCDDHKVIRYETMLWQLILAIHLHSLRPSDSCCGCCSVWRANLITMGVDWHCHFFKLSFFADITLMCTSCSHITLNTSMKRLGRLLCQCLLDLWLERTHEAKWRSLLWTSSSCITTARL